MKNIKNKFNLLETINGKLNQLESEGKIRVKDFGVHYDSKKPFANLAIGLGFYEGPAAAYVFVDNISKPVEEKKYIFFGKKVIRDSFNGNNYDLEKMLEPFGKDVIKNDDSRFPEIKNSQDSIYYTVNAPNNLVVIRSNDPNLNSNHNLLSNHLKSSYDVLSKHLDFIVDIYEELYYKDVKNEK